MGTNMETDDVTVFDVPESAFSVKGKAATMPRRYSRTGPSSSNSWRSSAASLVVLLEQQLDDVGVIPDGLLVWAGAV